MRSRSFAILAGLMLFSTACGQPPGGGPGRFGPPGMGPPAGGAASPAALLAAPEVLQELRIGEEQKKPLDELLSGFHDKMQEVFREFDPRQAQDDDDAAREQRFANMRTKFDELHKRLDEGLDQALAKEQVARLKQLRLQREGIQAFTRPEISDKLKLSGEQRRKIEEIQRKHAPLFGPPQPNPEAAKEALAVLDDAQKTTWREMTGGEFNFPESMNNFGPPGFGPGGRGPGGPMQEERKIVKDFDKNDDNWLNNAERRQAREFLKKDRANRPERRGPRGPGGGPGGPPGGPPGGGPRGESREEEGRPGPLVATSDVKPLDNKDLYDANVLRTLFLEFENDDWETELSDFHGTDVEVPAVLTVDGQKYPQVGLRFRGMSSFGMVRAGSKRSLNLSLDLVDSKQRLYGYKTLNLLNAHEDPSFLHTILYSHIARKYIPAPKANFVRLVVNGESWGVYVSAQQFDKTFVSENFQSKGTRWKVRGSPGGGGGLTYIGDKVEDYKRRYEMKSDDNDESWQALIKLCKTLNETPPDQLEKALEPMLDIDGALWFLALDNALINCDGYWIRASDYNIFLDAKGKFHFVPHDMNEAFQPPMGPGFGGGSGGPGGGRGGFFGFGGPPGGGRPPQEAPQGPPQGNAPGGASYNLDPLIGLTDAAKPLRSKLLAVPSLRERYLRHVRTIAEESLDWSKLGPVVAQYEAVVKKELAADTRKLSSLAAFEQALSTDGAPSGEAAGGRTGRNNRNLKTFADERRKYLLGYPEIKNLSR